MCSVNTVLCGQSIWCNIYKHEKYVNNIVIIEFESQRVLSKNVPTRWVHHTEVYDIRSFIDSVTFPTYHYVCSSHNVFFVYKLLWPPLALH